MELSKKLGPPKKRFGPAEVCNVPVQMTTRSQVLLLNSAWVHDGHPNIILLRKMVPTSVWQLLKLLVKLVGVVAVPPGRAIPNLEFQNLGACGSFFSGHSGFSSAIIQLGFMAFTEWIGILSSDEPVVVMDLTRILCFGGGVSELKMEFNCARGMYWIIGYSKYMVMFVNMQYDFADL